MPMVTSMDREIIREAYEDVRSNLTDTEWAVFKFESSEIVCAAKGIGFEEFQQQFMDDERAFGYIRIQMGLFAGSIMIKSFKSILKHKRY
jgi:hypothetical protein